MCFYIVKEWIWEGRFLGHFSLQIATHYCENCAMHYLRMQQVWTKRITRPKETTELEEISDSTQVPFPCVHSCSTFTQGRCSGHFLWYIFMPSFSRQVAAILWYLETIVCGRRCQHCNETRPRFLSPHGYFAYTILSTGGFAPDISTLQFYAFYTIKTFFHW